MLSFGEAWTGSLIHRRSDTLGRVSVHGSRRLPTKGRPLHGAKGLHRLFEQDGVRYRPANPYPYPYSGPALPDC